MKLRTSLFTMRIIMFYLLSVVGRSAATMEEISSSSLHNSRLSPLLNHLEYEEPAKKAFITEYKRLPLYTFGIGKRWIGNNENKRTRQFTFGVGKRLRDYSFGMGKRNNEYHPLNLDYLPTDNMDGYQSRDYNSQDFIEDKRGSQRFDFGIGKRVWKLPTGKTAVSGRRSNDAVVPKYLLDLGKNLDEDEDLNQ